MNDDAIFLAYRVDCIVGKPPPTVRCLIHDSAMPGWGQASYRNSAFSDLWIV